MYQPNPYPVTPLVQQTAYQNAFNPQYQFQKIEVVKVNGRNGAEAYNLPPNSSILLLDETAPIVWLKTTDGAGYPTISPYSISPYQPEAPVDVKSLEARITRLEEALNGKSYAKSNESRDYEATDSSNETEFELNKKRK